MTALGGPARFLHLKRGLLHAEITDFGIRCSFAALEFQQIVYRCRRNVIQRLSS